MLRGALVNFDVSPYRLEHDLVVRALMVVAGMDCLSCTLSCTQVLRVLSPGAWTRARATEAP